MPASAATCVFLIFSFSPGLSRSVCTGWCPASLQITDMAAQILGVERGAVQIELAVLVGAHGQIVLRRRVGRPRSCPS